MLNSLSQAMAKTRERRIAEIMKDFGCILMTVRQELTEKTDDRYYERAWVWGLPEVARRYWLQTSLMPAVLCCRDAIGCWERNCIAIGCLAICAFAFLGCSRKISLILAILAGAEVA